MNDDRTDVRMRGFASRVDVDDAWRRVRETTRPLGPETVLLSRAQDRVLGEAVRAPVPVPGFERVMMDGYAVRAEETFGATEYAPLRLRVVGEVTPGRGFDGVVDPGEAVRVMTGAPLPHGADAVVVAEHAVESRAGEQRRVDVREPAPPGRHVGAVGEDVAEGEEVLPAGRRLRPQDVGVLSSIGVSEVAVVRRPCVRIVPTGDELLPPGSRPEGFRIVDANSPMLAGLVARDGGEPETVAIVPDRRDAVADALTGGEADVVLVSGGSSVGVEDHAPAVLAAAGEVLFHGVAMRPSSPAGAGRIGERLVFLLPGNPVSCLCAYDFFAGPAIRRLGGRSARWPYAPARGRLAEKIASAVGRVDYVRVRLGGRPDAGADAGSSEGPALEVTPIAIRGASILSSTTRADGFVVVPADSEGLPARSDVEVFLYDAL